MIACSLESSWKASMQLLFGINYPIVEGHALVVPRRHVASLFDATSEEIADLWKLVSVVRTHLAENYVPDAFAIGLNDGVAAGSAALSWE